MEEDGQGQVRTPCWGLNHVPFFLHTFTRDFHCALFAEQRHPLGLKAIHGNCSLQLKPTRVGRFLQMPEARRTHEGSE